MSEIVIYRIPNFFHLFQSSKLPWKKTCIRREIFIDLVAKNDDEQWRVFLDRLAFSYSAVDLHGNKLTPWRSARERKIKNKKRRTAFDLSAYFRQVLDFCQAGRSISPEITVIIQPAAENGTRTRRTVKTPSTRGEVSRVAGICIKRAAVLQNQFELLRFRLSPRFLLCLVRSERGTLLTLLRPQKERLFAEHGNKVLPVVKGRRRWITWSGFCIPIFFPSLSFFCRFFLYLR